MLLSKSVLTYVRSAILGVLPVLQSLHDQGVIHHDLKPDNIMRRRDGKHVLIDFGVAKLLKQTVMAHAGAGTIVGPPGYASPEQIQRGQTKAGLPSTVTYLQGNRQDLRQYQFQIQAFAPDVVLDMIPYTAADAQTVIDTITGICPRIVAISSQDVYRARDMI